MYFLLLLLLVHSVVCYVDNYKPTVAPSLCVHDGKFVPDFVINVTLAPWEINCKKRSSVLLNGGFPGPLINVTEGQSVWVRVWNFQPVENFTMVRSEMR